MKRLVPLLAATTILSLSPAAMHALAQDRPEVARVDLGQSGLAHYTLRTDLSGHTIRFEVPNEHADDVLASLIVRDPAGGVFGVSTDTPSSAPEALRRTPFEAGIPTDIDMLLDRLRGETVTIRTATGEATGQVVAVARREEAVGETTIERSVALLLSEGRVAEVVLVPGVTVAFDQTIAAKLAAAGAARLADDGLRAFTVDLEGDTARTVALSYVTEAPAWKNSWRLLLDEGRLQGWAVLENVSGHDWNGVEVTLSTGSPVAYRRDLLDPKRYTRLDPPDLVGERPDVAADAGFAKASPRSAARADLGLMQNLAAAPPVAAEAADVSGAASEAGEVVGIGNVRYTIARPVDLPAGRTANLLYIDLPLTPEVRALYRPAASRTVLLAVKIAADRPLAPGLVSIRDANGFVGDAPFTGLASGETRLLPYAASPGAQVVEDRTETITATGFSFVGGVLSANFARTTRTRYDASLTDAVDVFSVEHPRGPADLVETSGEVERNPDSYRVSVPVENRKASVEIVERETYRRRTAVERGELAAFLAELGRTDPSMDAATRAILKEAADLLADAREAEEREAGLSRRYERISAEQARLRDNLESVQQTALRERYLAALDRTETEIGEIFEASATAREDIRKNEARLAEVLSSLK